MTNFPTFVKRETENFPTFIYVNNKPLKMNAIDLTNQMDLADRPDGTDTVRPPGGQTQARTAYSSGPSPSIFEKFLTMKITSVRTRMPITQKKIQRRSSRS